MLKALVISAVILVVANAPAQSKQKLPGSDGSAHNSTADKRGTNDSPLVVDAHAVYSDKEAAEEAAKVEEQKSTNRWNIGLASVIVVCALLQAIGIGGQVILYWKQMTFTFRTERAWITAVKPNNPDQSLFPNPAYTPGIVLKFKVFGRTAARLTKDITILRIIPAKVVDGKRVPDLPDTPDYTTKTPPSIPEGGMVVSPEREFLLSKNLESGSLKPSELSSLEKGETVMCGSGKLTYVDASGKERETRFCYVYEFAFGGVLTSPDNMVLNPPGFRMGGPPKYNDAT